MNYSDVQVRVIPNKRTYNSNSEGASVQSDRRPQGVSDPEGCRPVSAHPAELSTGSLVVPTASVSRSAGTWASRGSQGWGKTLRDPHPGPRTQVSAAGTVGSGILGFQDHSSSTWDPAENRDVCRFPRLYQTWRSRLSLPALACHAFGGQHSVTQTVGWEPRAVPFHVPHREVRAGWPE